MRDIFGVLNKLLLAFIVAPLTLPRLLYHYKLEYPANYAAFCCFILSLLTVVPAL
jgi:hypothetical protein